MLAVLPEPPGGSLDRLLGLNLGSTFGSDDKHSHSLSCVMLTLGALCSVVQALSRPLSYALSFAVVLLNIVLTWAAGGETAPRQLWWASRRSEKGRVVYFIEVRR